MIIVESFNEWSDDPSRIPREFPVIIPSRNPTVRHGESPGDGHRRRRTGHWHCQWQCQAWTQDLSQLSWLSHSVSDSVTESVTPTIIDCESQIQFEIVSYKIAGMEDRFYHRIILWFIMIRF